MAAGAWKVFGHALEKYHDGTIDLDTDLFRLVLVTSSWTPNQSTDDAWSDMSANEASGTGYTANGKALTQTLSRSGLVVTFDFDDQSWTSSTVTAKYAVVVRDADGNGALAAADIPLCYSDLDTGGGSLSSTSGPFSVTVHADGAFTATAS